MGQNPKVQNAKKEFSISHSGIIFYRVSQKTSQKWLTVAIFRKWQDRSVALWFGMVWYNLVLFCFVGIVWYGGGGQMTSEFIHEEI